MLKLSTKRNGFGGFTLYCQPHWAETYMVKFTTTTNVCWYICWYDGSMFRLFLLPWPAEHHFTHSLKADHFIGQLKWKKLPAQDNLGCTHQIYIFVQSSNSKTYGLEILEVSWFNFQIQSPNLTIFPLSQHLLLVCEITTVCSVCEWSCWVMLSFFSRRTW